MLQSKRGPLVLEVNSSPGLEGIEKATKQDIAGRIIDYSTALAGKKKAKPKAKKGDPQAVDAQSDVPAGK
jgi:ribosomal protein S6--L-glutamate ligase